jgi:hypothetical protein
LPITNIRAAVPYIARPASVPTTDGSEHDDAFDAYVDAKHARYRAVRS